MLEVITTGAKYLVDRTNTRWMRLPFEDIHPGDGEWIDGGFTLGEVGESCYAHFARQRRDGALGRRTSRLVSVVEVPDENREVMGEQK